MGSVCSFVLLVTILQLSSIKFDAYNVPNNATNAKARQSVHHAFIHILYIILFVCRAVLQDTIGLKK